jgi:hypothetical protein
VVPGDAIIVRRLEAAIVDRAPDRLVHVADETSVEGEAGEDREIAFRNAESQVATHRIAPLGNDAAVTQHQAIRAASWPDRPQCLVPGRLFLEIMRDGMREVPAPRRLALGGVFRRGVERRGIEPGGFGRSALPFGRMWWRHIDHERVFQWFRLDFRAIGTTSRISALPIESQAVISHETRRGIC